MCLLIVAYSICLFLTAFLSESRLSDIEIKVHTSSFITESLHCNYITYWDMLLKENETITGLNEEKVSWVSYNATKLSIYIFPIQKYGNSLEKEFSLWKWFTFLSNFQCGYMGKLILRSLLFLVIFFTVTVLKFHYIKDHFPTMLFYW